MLFLIASLLMANPSFAGEPARKPASSQCITSPVITCKAAYAPYMNKDNCYTCKRIDDERESCVTKPVLTCTTGYSNKEDDEGCYHCVTN